MFIGGALVLYAWRTSRIGLGGGFEPVSRESFLLANNVLLAAAAGTVFLGTLYPLAIDAFGAGKISVGPPYFEAVFVPLMAPALFLMGVGPLARWKRASLPELAVLLRWALGVSLVARLAVCRSLFGDWSALVGFGLALAIWIVHHRAAELQENPRARRRSHYGMALAHIGVAVFVVGVTLVKGYESAGGRAPQAGRQRGARRLRLPPRRGLDRARTELRRGARPRRASRATASRSPCCTRSGASTPCRSR